MRPPSRVLISGALFLSLIVSPPTIHAQSTGSPASNPCAYDGDVATILCVNDLFERILSVALGFVLIATLIMLMVGGIQMLISQGDPKQTALAANTIKYAIGGLIALFIVWFVLVFISETIDAPELLEFNISTS